MKERLIKPARLDGLTPAEITGSAPEFRWVRPGDLLVDETYQRHLTDKSVKLVRKIVDGWSWAKFKPPIVALTDAGMEVIDGQHTAIAAVTHGGIEQIPVMIVEASERADRAGAFVGHNRDRIALTPTQIHYAAVEARDENALVVDEVCREAGVKLLRVQPSAKDWKIADTIAVGAINSLIINRGTAQARTLLRALVDANLAPISAAAIRATDMLMFEDEYASISVGSISATFRQLGYALEQMARVFAASHNVPYWKALGITIYRNRRKAAA